MHLLPDHATAATGATGSCARLVGVDLKTGLSTYACTVWFGGHVCTATLTSGHTPTHTGLFNHLCDGAGSHAWTVVAKPSSSHV